MTKLHFGTGEITNFVAALDITRDVGLGSSDGIHLANILRKAKDLFPRLTEAVADQGYGWKRNYTEAQADLLAIDLIVRERKNEDRLDPKNKWPAMAQRLAKLERATDPRPFEDIARMRPKAELTPARVKRRHPCTRLRRRKADPLVEYPPELEGLEDKKLSELPEPIIAKVLEVASEAVGYAKRADGTGSMADANLRAYVMFEELTGETIDLSEDGAFSPIRTVREEDVIDASQPHAVARV
jgi:hypothetical protein